MKEIEIIDGRVWCEGCSQNKNVDEFYYFNGKIKRPCKVCKGGKSILQFLQYTIDILRAHIENLFEPWMTWENWGSYRIETWDDNDPTTWTWHIDHIISQAKLPYVSMEDDNFKICWALSNLRPLSAKQNVIKGNT